MFYSKGRRVYFNEPTVPPVVPPPTPPRTFNQEEVNKLLADNKRALQKTNEELVTQLTSLKENATLTVQQKEELESRIETLQNQHLTKEQQLAKDADNWKKKYEKDTVALIDNEKAWKSRFENLMITNSILTGANKHGAVSADQMVMLLSGRAKVVETVGEDGKSTGVFDVKTKVKSVDPKTKQPVELELSIIDAIGEMKKDDSFMNLFAADEKAGLGGGPNPRRGQTGPSGFNKDFTPEQYAIWRKTQG